MEHNQVVFTPSKKIVLIFSATLLFIIALKLNSVDVNFRLFNQTLITERHNTNLLRHYARHLSVVD